METKQTLRHTGSQVLRQKQMGRMKLGQFFSLPEDEFRKLVVEVEDDPLFHELVHEWKVVSYRRFAGVRSPPSFELKEDLISQVSDFDLEILLHRNPKILSLLQKIGNIIGENRFRKLLRTGAGLGEIQADCGLTLEETETFKDFLDKFELEKLTSGSSVPSPAESTSFSPARTFKIASIEKDGDRLNIYPYLKEDYLVKGRYSVNLEQYEALHTRRRLVPEKLKRISNIFRMLDLINRRTTMIYRIIRYITEAQSDYLSSGDIGRLRPLTRREMAGTIGVHPSSVTRVMMDKSIGTPQEKELPLGFFFPSQKEITKHYLEDIISEEGVALERKVLLHPYSDELIRDKLCEDYHIRVSRRAVAKYRNELNIPSSSRRIRKMKECPSDDRPGLRASERAGGITKEKPYL